MKEKKHKKPKPYDYRNRVLAVRNVQRLQKEGNKAMTTTTTPPVTAPDATAPVAHAPVPAEVLNPDARVPVSAAKTTLVDTKTTEPPRPASTGEGTAEATESKSARKKPKAEPETLEQFIEYAYGRKGQPLTLKSKVEKLVAQNAQLDDAALIRLLQLAKSDTLLAVPRQILLLSQEVSGLSSLKAALTSFVSNVMLRHSAFSDAKVQETLRNLPESLPPAAALARVAAFEPCQSGEEEPLKGGELRELRNNAVRLFVTWLALNRNLKSEELASLLFQVVWEPAVKDLADDNARLRALTEIGQADGVGLACHQFRQQAIEARTQQDQALREANSLRDRLTTAETQLTDTATQLGAIQAELQAQRESSAAEIEALRRQHAVDRTHLQHELEQLRGRLVKRLTDSVDMLDVGLSALRKDAPRVPVMVERAEHVVDALRAEIENLKEV